MKTVLFNFEYKHSSFNGHQSGGRHNTAARATDTEI